MGMAEYASYPSILDAEAGGGPGKRGAKLTWCGVCRERKKKKPISSTLRRLMINTKTHGAKSSLKNRIVS